ncbi:MAG: hypothetical protein U0992_10640 [Planctomycetaceae bacterium]
MSERWHFQIDGKRYGPVPTTDLERFLAPPRLCRFMEVLKEGSDEWVAIGPHDDLSTALKRLGVVLPPRPATSTQAESTAPRIAPIGLKTATAAVAPAAAGAAATRPWRPGLLARLRYALGDAIDAVAEFIARFWVPFALVAVLGAINLGIYLARQFDYPADREIRTTYVEIWNEYLKLQEAKTTKEQWQAFSKSSESRLTPLIEGLATRTDAETPLRRHLLWAGRDCLVPLVSSAGGERQQRTEINFQQHLNAIDQLLRNESPQPMRGAPRM